MNKTSIITYSGIVFDYANPTVDMIDIKDIAHALAYQCRFNGHTSQFYSVAQHSVIVSVFTPEYALAGLLHDAAEAYLGDIVSPLKKLLPAYQKLEKRLEILISQKFRFEYSDLGIVKKTDHALLANEFLSFFSEQTQEQVNLSLDLPITIKAVTPQNAEIQFLETYHKLTRPSNVVSLDLYRLTHGKLR